MVWILADNFRPYLTSFQGNAFTDYINAVFVDVNIWFASICSKWNKKNIFNFQGYTKPREYIVTEWPLKHTVGEFWSLVYDQECSAVVVLLQPPPNSVSLNIYSLVNELIAIFIFFADNIPFILAREK